MDVKYQSANGQFEVTFTGIKDQVTLFEEIASFQEVFETGEVKIAGKVVPNDHIQFRVRVIDDNKYFEKSYVGPDKELWGFKLPYGQNKKGGGLFPKYSLPEDDAESYESGGGGWRRYKGKKDSQAKEESVKTNGKAPF